MKVARQVTDIWNLRIVGEDMLRGGSDQDHEGQAQTWELQTRESPNKTYLGMHFDRNNVFIAFLISITN